MKICIVRHGQTDWNKEGKIQGRTDIPLNDFGKLQAEKSANVLAHEEYDYIITSPLKRAYETAEIIAQKTNLPIIVMDEFMEKFYGDIEGLTVEERELYFPNGKVPKNQETMDQLTERVKLGLQRLVVEYPNSNIILVSHGAFINALLKYISNDEIGTGKTRLENACLNRICLEDKTFKIETYNEVSHLYETYSK